jgi:hypothetical protein
MRLCLTILRRYGKRAAHYFNETENAEIRVLDGNQLPGNYTTTARSFRNNFTVSSFTCGMITNRSVLGALVIEKRHPRSINAFATRSSSGTLNVTTFITGSIAGGIPSSFAPRTNCSVLRHVAEKFYT